MTPGAPGVLVLQARVLGEQLPAHAHQAFEGQDLGVETGGQARALGFQDYIIQQEQHWWADCAGEAFDAVHEGGKDRVNRVPPAR